MGAHVNFDLSQYREFFQKMSTVAKDGFKKDAALWLDAIGNDFLRVVEEEIIKREVVDTRLLLHSFHKGSDGNVWELDLDGLTIEVGTSVEYADYVNSGHWTNPKGQSGRWIPGSWDGDRFIYQPGAKTGMFLKQKWVPGKHYFDSALRAYEKIFQTSLEKKLEEWVETHFGG